MLKIVIGSFLFLLVGSIYSQNRFQRNGIADNLDGNCFTFRRNTSFTGGSVFSIETLNKSEFFAANVRIYPGCLDENGDGITFMFQPIGPFAGSFLQRLGSRGLSPSLSIELDLDPNPEDNDPAYDHLAIMINGVQDHHAPENLAGPVRVLNQVDNIEDCDIHFMNIEWSPQTKMLEVYFDCNLRLSREIRFEDYFGEQKIHSGVTVGVKGGGIEYSVCPDHIEILVGKQEFNICRGNRIELKPTRPAETFKWYQDSTLIAIDLSSIVVMPIVDQTFFLYSIDSCGRRYKQDYFVQVQADSLPIDIGPPDTLLCEGMSIELKANILGAAYIWQDGSQAASYTVTKAGKYKLIASLGHCINSDSIEVFKEESRQVNWPEELFACQGELLNIGTGLNSHYSHSWSSGETTNAIQVYESGMYAVNVVSHCDDVHYTTNVVFDDCSPFYVPNVFSPNGDQINDVYQISSSISGIKILEWTILDRWGTNVVNRKNFITGEIPSWDGRNAGGEIAPSGVYVLFVKFQLPNGHVSREVHDLSLIR